jgi:hypothetical protein
MEPWHIFIVDHFLSYFYQHSNTYAEQINKCRSIFKFAKKNHCIGGSLSIHIIVKTSSNVENMLGFNGQYSQFPDDNL